VNDLTTNIQDTARGGTVPAPPLASAQPATPWKAPRETALFLFLLGILLLPPLVYADDGYRIGQFAKIAALALLALSIDLIWGYTGLLSLGQGLFFGIGAYAVAYSLSLQQAALGEEKAFVAAPDMALPNFMMFSRFTEVPEWIAPLINIYFAVAVAILLPTLFAAGFGFITFRLRIKGVYFSLITQALILTLYLIVIRQLPYTGGHVGMGTLNKLDIFGYRFGDDLHLYFLIAAILVVSYIGCAILMNSKFGQLLTAIRDNENRVMALGYNPALYKTFIFTLSSALAGLAGALYVSANHSVGPKFLQIDFSILAVIWVAVGGRGTLVGAILGAYLVEFGKILISEQWPFVWTMILGALFILVVLVLPTGIMGSVYTLVGAVETRWRRFRADPDAAP
jgi:urea transport system permease protein